MAKRKLAEVAAEIMREREETLIYYGNPELCHDIADRAGMEPGRHPLNIISAVIQSCAKSPLFFHSGEIEHLGRHYPVYELRPPITSRGN